MKKEKRSLRVTEEREEIDRQIDIETDND